MSLAAFLSDKPRKAIRRRGLQKKPHKHTEKKPKEEPLIPPNIAIPKELLPQECAALRAIVHVFDPDVTATITPQKCNAIIAYLQEYITKYNTQSLRNLIPEQAGDNSDEETIEEEALRTGENLEETSDESDSDQSEDYTPEDRDFVVPDTHVEYDEGTEEEEPEEESSEDEKPKRKRIRKNK
jgi:hypothetical protein